MIDKKTVFVLGAGASCPYGYPAGAQLRKEMCLEKQTYLDYLKRAEPDKTRRKGKWEIYRNFADVFFRSSTESIDLFLARNPNLIGTGKYIIAFKMLGAEQSSHFREQAVEGQDWYRYLFNRLTRGLTQKNPLPDFSSSGISFITFNYDRSLEHFLYESLNYSFLETPDYEIIHMLKDLKIIHVYGTIAPLDWQDRENGVRYASPVTEELLQRLARNIRTIYEEMENPQLQEAIGLLREAEQIFLLGFGYAKENMEILQFPHIISSSCEVVETAYGLEGSEVDDIRNRIIAGLKTEPIVGKNSPRIEIKSIDSLMLLRNYL